MLWVVCVTWIVLQFSHLTTLSFHPPSMAKVLVYQDTGVQDVSHASILHTLKELCRDTHDVQSVSSQVLAMAPWDASTRLVVMPHIHQTDTDAWTRAYGLYCAKQRITDFLKSGGTALCLGQSLACIQADLVPDGDSYRATMGKGHILWHASSEPDAHAIENLLRAASIHTRSAPPCGIPKRTPLFLASFSRPLLDACVSALRSHATSSETVTYIPDVSDTWHLCDASTFAVPTNDDEGVTQVVCVTRDQLDVVRDATQAFNLASYFDALASARASIAALVPWSAPRSFHFAAGNLVGYARVMKSTQTLLDANPHMLGACPPGTTMFATQQVQGRGRGSNVWISPYGCLQFSTLVPLPLHIGNKAVFLQYLAALAVVYGVNSAYPSAQGRIRIKWPNDLYAHVPAPQNGSLRIVENGVEKHFVKIGGILVTAVCSRDTFQAIVGCGVNCLNQKPTTCIRALVTDEAVTQEGCAGAIMATLESLVRVFADTNYTFEPFANAYREAWLHSDQPVELSDAPGEPRRRIVGITSDYGLLRTVPYDASIRATDPRAWSAAPIPGAADVQPDGNSFDMLRGLVRKKEGQAT